METHTHTNRLIGETSPYLLQHAHNPVQWYPWGEEALARARREDKPILLSVGYSACHWCHVMEHESFEDEEVARVMNELYVCIKVDREERPDLDKIYQTAYQLLTQRAGGWPLNMFLTPDDHLPFYGGTYFPKTPKYGMPGFTDILRQIATTYRERRAAIREQNESLRSVFARLQPPAEDMPLRLDILDQARAQLKTQFDSRFGGFGGAPKFPHPTSVDFLLREWARGARAGQPSEDTLHVARFTLQSMAHGGIYDQLGGGFYRYSVDARWTIPHFEKMLYDNALLLPLYADLVQITGEPLYRRIVAETAGWVMREMQAPDGGYYSTLDADSEGHEGKFYTWTSDEIRALLTPDEWRVVELHYGLAGSPNFEGAWHLNVHMDTTAVAERLQQPERDVGARLDGARATLLRARAQRVRPARDEKILTSWNGLMIKAMAHAGSIMRDAGMITSAAHAFDFVRAHLWKNRRLLATTKDGKAHLNAYLDDYVFLIDAGLELLQARFRAADLAFITELADVLLEQFADGMAGGFYFTGTDHEQLAYRPKPTTDDATPSGNGVAARVLLRLGHLLGETRYLDAAERTLEAMGPAIAQYPAGHGALLAAMQEYLEPPQTIVLRGRAPILPQWETRCFTRYAPARLTLAIPDDTRGLPGLLNERKPVGEIAAYVCTGHACQAPVTALDELEKALASSEVALT